MSDSWEQLLDRLHREVLASLDTEHHMARDEMARLANDYESFLRMGHAPARARRIADQLLFQQRQYGSDEDRDCLALRITATLAEIYRDRLGRLGQGQ